MVSHLSNRSQAVRVGESVSMKGVVSMGVPQGSILGPLLFLLYINDLPNISDSLTSILFADDTTLLSSSKELKDVLTAFSIEVPKVGEWCAANRLSINVSKTFALHFTRKASY